MKIASYFTPQGKPSFGIITGETISDLSAYGALMNNLDRDLTALKSAKSYSLSDIRYDLPIPSPQKIICVGVNYANRNEEYKDGQEAPKYPSLFVRFPTSFVGANEALIRPKLSEQLDYEGEIVLVMGKDAKNLSEENALSHVFGVTLANEGTIRDWVRHAKFNVTQGKNFDKSGSIGSYIVTNLDLEQSFTLQTKVNGEVRQHDTTDSMMWGFKQLLVYITSFTTLKAGDMILTGTPVGAGARFDPPKWLKAGDVVEVSVEGIGTLKNSVLNEK